MSDRAARKYFENIPYGQDSKASEIHGKNNQLAINTMVQNLVMKHDALMAVGDKNNANHFKEEIYQISQELDNLKSLKEEFALNYGGGQGGKNMFSNYTDLTFDRQFWVEQGEILFDESGKLILSAKGPDGNDIVKRVEDITENWVVRGSEENDFMARQQSAVRQRNNMGTSLDFDIDWEVSKMLENEDAWKIFASDKIGGRYFVNDYIEENEQAIRSGELTDDMLHPDSFNPAFDNRLHDYFANRLRKAFDPNFQTPAEAMKADELIARNNTKNTES